MEGFIELITHTGEEFSPRVKDIQAVGSVIDERGGEKPYIVYHNRLIYLKGIYWNVCDQLAKSGAPILYRAELPKAEIKSFLKHFPVQNRDKKGQRNP